MIKDLSTPKPPKLYGSEYAAWCERVNGITMDRLRETFGYDEANPAAPLVRIKQGRGKTPKTERTSGSKYRRLKVGDRYYSMSRMVWVWHHGSIPGDMELDHINRDSQDNRIENLRIVSRSDNNRNRQISGKSMYRGVTWMDARGKWAAQIMANGRGVHIGLFDTEAEAASAWDAGMRLFHGPDHTHPSNTSEGLINRSQVDSLPIGELVPLRKALGLTARQWAKAKANT